MSLTRRGFEFGIPMGVGMILNSCSGPENQSPVSTVTPVAMSRPRPSIARLDSDRAIATHPLFVIKNYASEFGVEVDYPTIDAVLKDRGLGINFNRSGTARAFIALVDYPLGPGQEVRRAEEMMRSQLPRVVQEYNTDQGRQAVSEGSFYLRAISISDDLREIVRTGTRGVDPAGFAEAVASALSADMGYYTVMAVKDSSPFFSVVKPPVNLSRATVEQVGALRPIRVIRFPARLINPTPTARSAGTI